MVTRRTIVGSLAAGAFLPSAGRSQAAFPSKPIRLLTPNPPGGGTDITARLLGDVLSRSLRQPVVVESRPGANNAIAAAALVNAEPDGHTLMVGLSGIVQNPWLTRNLPYRLEQLVPISLFTRIPIAYAVSASLPVQSLDDLIALAREKPGGLSYASYGVGSSAHAYGELINRSAGIQLLHVPYRGEQPAVTDVISGQVSSAFAGPGTLAQQARAGKVRIIAVASARRTPLIPEVPTFIEVGVPAIAEAGWSAIFAPPGTPSSIIERLNREISTALADPVLTGKLLEYMEPTSSSPAELAAIVQSDYERWGSIFRAIDLKPQ